MCAFVCLFVCVRVSVCVSSCVCVCVFDLYQFCVMHGELSSQTSQKADCIVRKTVQNSLLYILNSTYHIPCFLTHFLCFRSDFINVLSTMKKAASGRYVDMRAKR